MNTKAGQVDEIRVSSNSSCRIGEIEDLFEEVTKAET